jgi:hypothetical protein
LQISFGDFAPDIGFPIEFRVLLFVVRVFIATLPVIVFIGQNFRLLFVEMQREKDPHFGALFF